MRVQRCSSSLLSVLIELRAQILAKEGQLCLSAVADELKNLLLTVLLDKILEICKTTREALDSMR